MDINKEKKRRFEFLKLLFNKTDGYKYTYVEAYKLGKELELDKKETNKIVDYLVDENLIKREGSGAISIKHAGVKEMEEAINGSNKPTEHPPTTHILHVEKMVNSQIQQGTHKSSQKKDIGNIKIGEINEAKKKGYVAGTISVIICGVIFVMILNLGWDLTGQILTVFCVLFGVLGAGSFAKPETIGHVTDDLLKKINKKT